MFAEVLTEQGTRQILKDIKMYNFQKQQQSTGQFLGFLAKFAVKFRRLVVNWSIGPNKILIRKGFCIYR